MEKLELKHIVGYLPYGLDMQHKYTKAKHRGETKLRLWQTKLQPLSLTDLFYKKGKSFDFHLILRPLSDLTKEIEVNGEKFVPIIIIAKMFGFDDLQKFELDDGVIEYGWVEHYMDDYQPYSFGYFQNGEFGTWYDDIDNSHPIQVHCKMQVIEWLYEHHFDIHGGIGKWAIDINTLPNNN